jgi:hypothetical protein
MRKFFFSILTLAASVAGAASAQDLDATSVTEYCSAEAAFGLEFGERITPDAVIRPMGGPLSQSNLPVTTFPPFVLLNPMLETANERIVAVFASADARHFNSPAEMPGWFRELAEALRATGRFATINESATTDGSQVIRLYSSGPRQRRGLVVVLRQQDDVIAMHCADAARFPLILEYRFPGEVVG